MRRKLFVIIPVGVAVAALGAFAAVLIHEDRRFVRESRGREALASAAVTVEGR